MNYEKKHTNSIWAQQKKSLWVVLGILTSLLISCGHSVGTLKAVRILKPARAVVSGDWSSYLMGGGREGFNQNETIINPTTAPRLKLHWATPARARIFSQPVVADGVIYWGSGDGLEHATNLNGKQIWAVNLGTSRGICNSDRTGVISTATVAPVVIGGKQTSVVFVGGGNAHFYALNAVTGAVIWSTFFGSSPQHFLWSSPLVYEGSVYEGVSSLADCPLVQGGFVQMDAATGSTIHTLNTVPDGCLGGSVWGSPTLDMVDGSIYFATGNGGRCSKPEPYAVALVKLRAKDLSFIAAWQVPPSQQIPDSDFGSTPTLFDVTIGGITRHLVGVVNKNTWYYAFDRTAIGKGPVWSVRLACYCNGGGNTIAPGAWDGTHLYLASQAATIGTNTCAGSLRAVNPANGTFIWEHCLNSGAVFGAVTMAPGLAMVSAGSHFFVIAAATGKTLFRYFDSNRSESFMGPASVSNGVIYIGSYGLHSGKLYAFGL